MKVELNSFVCKNCNATLDPADAVGDVLHCKYCYTTYVLPKSLEPRVRSILDQGEHELDACRFEDAAASYEKAAALDKEEPEAYFGMALAEFKVQYLKDEASEPPRLQPICHEVSEKSFSADKNYQRALRLATPEQRAAYVKKAAEIDAIKKEFYALQKSGLDYDCFLCVKVSDDNGGKTADSDRANEIYYHLRDKGYRPFYSEREIKGRTGSDYEALILYALYRSECMLVVCSDESYLKTKWVKNEYTRFMAMIANEEKERDAITFVFKGKPVERLPGKSGKIQGIDIGKMDAFSRITDFVESHTPEARARREAATRKQREEEEARNLQFEEMRRKLEESEQRERKRREAEEAQQKREEESRLAAAKRAKEDEEKRRAEEEARNKELAEMRAALEELKRSGATQTEQPVKTQPKTTRKASAATAAPDAGVPMGNMSPAQLLAMMRQAEEEEKQRKEEEERRAREEREKEEKRKAEEAKRKAAEEAARLKWEWENAPTVDNYNKAEFTISNGVLTKYTGNKSNVIIPAGVTEIGAEAFLNAPITSVKFPSSLTEIGDRAFKNTQLTEADLPEKVKKIGKEAFCGAPIASVKLPANLTEISYGAFMDTQLTEVDFPEGLLKVGNWAFGNCTKLKISRLPDSIEEIGVGAFSGCDLPKEFVLPVGVKKIDTEAFGGPSEAFGGPKKIKKITIKKEAGLIEFPGRYPHETFLSVGWEPDQVEVEAGNAYYFSPGGGLAEKKSGHLLFATAKTELPSDGSIKGIRRGAYTKVKGLTHLTIPGCVKKIEEEAIRDCPDLEELVIENGVEEVYSGSVARCEKLKRVKIGESVKFNYYASRSTFIRDCKNIEYETIEDPKLVAVHLKEKEAARLAAERRAREMEQKRREEERRALFAQFEVQNNKITKYIGKGGDVVIPDCVKSIGVQAFHHCEGLTSATIPGSVKSIGEQAFYLCNELKSVTILDGVKSIGAHAFDCCIGLTSITIPESVTEIGEKAFQACYGLTSMTIPESVTEIGEQAFVSCKGLTSVTILGSVKSIGRGMFLSCLGLTSVTIPGSVTEIGELAFRNCRELTRVDIPESVTVIGEEAFFCSGLTGIEIPNAVTEIGASAFRDCRELKSVTIPDSVKSIDKYAFDGCPSLEKVTMPKRLAGFMKSKLKSYFGDRWKQIDYTFTD